MKTPNDHTINQLLRLIKRNPNRDTQACLALIEELRDPPLDIMFYIPDRLR